MRVLIPRHVLDSALSWDRPDRIASRCTAPQCAHSRLIDGRRATHERSSCCRRCLMTLSFRVCTVDVSVRSSPQCVGRDRHHHDQDQERPTMGMGRARRGSPCTCRGPAGDARSAAAAVALLEAHAPSVALPRCHALHYDARRAQLRTCGSTVDDGPRGPSRHSEDRHSRRLSSARDAAPPDADHDQRFHNYPVASAVALMTAVEKRKRKNKSSVRR